VLIASAPNDAAATPIDVATAMMLVLLVVGIAVIFVLYTRGKIAKRRANDRSPREQIDEIKSRATRRTDTTAALVDVLDSAQRLAAQLDNKAERLEILIQQADERLARLESTGSAAADDLRDAIHEARRADEQIELDPLTAEIHRLADEGRSPVEIARALDETTGKVQLVLALRRSSR